MLWTTEQDGSWMSPLRRSMLVGYLLILITLTLYGLLRLNHLEFPDVALSIQAPVSPPVMPKPPAGSPVRPVLKDVFPYLRGEPVPDSELALYGSGFLPGAQVRLNGKPRSPKPPASPLPAPAPPTPAPPAPAPLAPAPPDALPDGLPENLLIVVPAASDITGTGVLVIDVLNPNGETSNAVTLKVDRPRTTLRLLYWKWTITREMQLLLIVLFGGALGSLLHAIKSLADFIGNRTAVTSWSWWYLTRPFLGGALALVVYSVFRGGFLTGTPGEARVVSPFGALAVAAMVGMFADKASQKLAEVFETLFKADDKRSGKLGAPAIDKLLPPTLRTGAAGPVELKIVGERLGKVTAVRVDGKDRKPTKVSDREVIVVLETADLATTGARTIAVMTPEAESPAATLQVSDLEITTAALPPGQMSFDYPATVVAATGGTAPYRWSAEGLPDGLSIEKGTGTLKGKPAKEGLAKPRLTVVDSKGASAIRDYTLQIAP